MRYFLLLGLALASCSSPTPGPEAEKAKPGANAVAPAPKEPAPATKPRPEFSAPATSQAAEAPVRANPFGVPTELNDAQDYFPPGEKDPKVAAPASVLQVEVGRRPAHHEEVARLWREWARTSPRVRLEVTGRTHEGRELLAGVVTSEKNMARLDEILAGLHQLADPRKLSQTQATDLVEHSPAVAWMAYSIHGDEMSGVDAGLALAYQLIADQGAETKALLDDLVVVFDPMQNPDGRERFLAMLESSASTVLDLSDEGLTRGHWPYGRGNHYLFDMNRDWMSGVAPETRARWAAVLKYVPQLFVDAHEMGSSDTFLFYPQSPPRHPDFPATLDKWHRTFADEGARAFDEHGWSYYSREWADGLGPFYSDSWGSLNGAIGILYEQARYAGTAVRRDTGEIATYRDAVRHQLVSSLSNLRSLKTHRKEVLADYLANRRENCDASSAERKRSFIVRAGAQPARERWLIENLLAQGIEVYRTQENAKASDDVDALGAKNDSRDVPAGSWLVPAAQPQGALVRAFLNFDPRLEKTVLALERKELETKGTTKMYDVTAWNLGQALGLDCSWGEVSLGKAQRVSQLDAAPVGVIAAADSAAHVYGWAVDANDDSAVRFAARALAAGLAVEASDEAFTAAGHKFARGSLLVRAHENPTKTRADVERAAHDGGAQAFALTTARSPDESADLGGQHFRALSLPHVAIAGGAPASSDGFGHVWHLIDRELGLPATLLDGAELAGTDLRRFDVLVLPPGGFDLNAAADDLKAWVRSGGTLIAIEDSALAACTAELGLSQVRERRKVLADLAIYEEAARREDDARKIEIDEAKVYGDAQPAPEAPSGAAEKKSKPETPSKEELERSDDFNRRFAPSGAVLRARTDPDAWITAGAASEVPVFYSGSQVLLAKPPVRTAVRLAPADQLRLSGLVWPEARDRLSRAAWLTVERVGRGQVILFATQPNFRSFWQGGARFLANAVVLGPGLGADPLRRP
jgi:hypothetical protein